MKTKFKITIFSLMLGISVFSFAGNASAYVTWPDITAMSYKEVLEKITGMIHGIIMGALKQAAVQTINDSVNNLISGTTMAGSMFISDWDNYLRMGPQRENALYMNDFFTMTTRGRASGLNYRSNCGRDFARSDYSSYLTDRAQKYTIAIEMPTVDLQEYVCDAANMFEDETWGAFDAFTGKAINNPLGYTLTAQGVQQADEARRKKEAEIRAIAYQGFKPQTKGDMVVTPGSTIKDVVSNVKDLPNKALAAAKDMPEVITSIVTSILTKTIQQGIGNARGNIQREIDGKICNFSKGINGKLNGFSPEGRFDMPSFSRGSSSSSQYRGMNCNIR
ncbi:hypothetical protein J7J13_01215 [bacterium]|nr:hypothetical protein [bacterium]